MTEAIKQRGILISDKCCDYSKKKPINKYCREVGCDLVITGERKAEGGARSYAHESCFEKARRYRWDKFMPLFFWTDEVKKAYKEHEGIIYSECYEKYGMTRTGCVGCPFNSNANEDLRIMKKFEPNLLKACMNVFGTSYRLMDEFKTRRKRILTGIE